MSKLGVHSSMTTAYHPQANGMVERLHRQLKGSLKAALDDGAWIDALPLVLLGIRSAWKEGANTTPAEMLYGESLRLPGQFIPTADPFPSAALSSSDHFVKDLFSRMRQLRPVPSAHHSSSVPAGRVPLSLMEAKQVYVRHDAVRRPLQQPYLSLIHI